MKLTAGRVVAVLLLIALSVGFGFAFDAIATQIEQGNHPRPEELAPLVQENSVGYGLPEHTVWALLKVSSDFQSNAVSPNGAIGLCSLTPAQFSFICTKLHGGEELNDGLLYDPETNLRAGAAYLSYLYDRYGVWDHAFAAYRAGTDAVDAWLQSAELISDQGVLTEIPDDEAAAFVSAMQKAVHYYSKLYY